VNFAIWNLNFLAPHFVVVPTVFKLLANFSADFESMIRRHRYVSEIEQRVYIASKQQAVGHGVFAAYGIWTDVCRF